MPQVKELFSAIERKDLAQVQALVEFGVSLIEKDNNGETVLLCAATHGFLPLVQWLVEAKKVSLNEKDNYGNTALHLAAVNGHLPLVRWLVESKEVSLTKRNNYGNTALHLAALNGHLLLVQWLVEVKGVRVNETTYLSRTALTKATWSGDLLTIHWLLQQGAKKVLLDNEMKNVEAVTLLAARGSTKWAMLDKISVSNEQINAVKKGIANQETTLQNLLPQIKHQMVTQVDVAGDWLTKEQLTELIATIKVNPLIDTCYIGYQLKRASQQDRDYINNRFPLYLMRAKEAARAHEVERLKWLTAPDSSLYQSHGYTAVHIAASLGDIALLTVLQRHGANLTTTDKLGKTPLDKAKGHNQLDVVCWFEGAMNHSTTPHIGQKLAEQNRSQSQTASTRSKPLPPRKIVTPTQVLEHGTVIEAYQATDVGELTVNKGVIVDVLRKEESGWWYCRYNGKEGLLPSTFLEPVPDKVQQKLATPLPKVAAKSMPSPVSATTSTPNPVGHHGIVLGVSASSYLIPHVELTFGQELGQGGFGVVYKGSWYYNNVAIKTLLIKNLSETTQQEFEQESNVMIALNHPNIVRLYGISLDKIPYCLVMELMSNGSLYSYLHSKKPLTQAVQYQIALDITKGLLFLHSKSIIHRDLKSHNVLLGDKLEAKLADFGLAKVKIETSASITKTSRAGTHRWMGPELFKRGVKQSSKSDMFSYAVTLWELVTGKLPFADAVDGFQVSQWIKDGEREDIPPDCLPVLAELITDCWAQNPDERLTAEQALQKLIAPSHSSIPLLKISSNQLTLGKQLGKGGFGIVVEGAWQDKKVAIKILFLANQQVLDDLLAEFQQEINVMSKLNHPNIVSLYGTSETAMMGEKLPCMVLELMSNGSLKSYLIKSNKNNNQTPLTKTQQHQIMLDITQGLAFLHHKKIIHRDLKPDNVLLDETLHAKLADFGLAKVKETNSASMTEGCGTSGGWMAPELLSYAYNEHGKLNHTFKSDMFSYAMTLWAVWACCPKPFKQVLNPIAINQMIIQGEREIIPTDCTPLIHQLITTCWAAEPNKRLTADEALAQLVNESATSSFRPS